MKKAAAFIFVCVLLLQVFSISAFAATESNAYISRYSAYISNPSNGVVRVDFSVRGTGYMDVLGASYIDLYENGTLVKTFSMYNALYAPTMVTNNAFVFYGYVTYSANPGSTYYAVVTAYAANSYGSGTESCTTGSVTIPSP